jgi:PEP-CTERM motif
MTNSRIRIQTAVLAFVLLPAAVGVLAVHASPTCERFVRTYVTKPVRNQVSKATLEAWTKWRIAHPNWKPNPKVHRPKYVMSRDEAVNKVEFACTIPTDPEQLDLLFNKADLEAPLPVINLPPMEGTQVSFPDVVPPEVAELAPTGPPLATFVPPILGSATPPPPVGGTVPEPPSFLLAALGIGILGFIARMKKLQPNSSK